MNQKFVNLNQLSYKITKHGLKFLVENGIIKVDYKDDEIFVCEKDIKKHEEWERKFSNEYFTVRQLWGFLGVKTIEGKKLTNAYYKNLIKLAEKGIIHIRILRYPLITLNDKDYQNVNQFIRKREIIDILHKYVPTSKFLKMVSIGYSYANDIVNKFNIEKIKFLQGKEMTFYNKKDIESFLKYREKTVGDKIRLNVSDESLLIKEDVCKMLNLNSFNYKKFINEGILQIQEKIGRNIFFTKDKVIVLKNQIEKMDKKLRTEYYTRHEVIQEYGMNVDAIREGIEKIEVPLLVRGISRYLYNRCLYLKKDIIKEYNRRSEKINLYLDKRSLSANVLYRLGVEGIEFSERCKETKLLWFEFLNSKSVLYSGQNNASKAARVLEYFSATKFLSQRLTEKEIFMCSSKELNLMFFNKNTGIYIQKPIYVFLKELDKSEEGIFKNNNFRLSEINSPYKISSKKKRSNDIYSPEEFKKFFDYISNLDFHKERAIRSVKEVINKSVTNNPRRNFYNQYDSVWLYMLIHLNNAWRHWDCTEIPRINFEGTSIVGTIDWLENNQISIEDAKTIVRKLQIKNLKHSKTGSTRYFYCSEQLILPVAYAIVLCEIRSRELNPLSESLIDFRSKNRVVTSYPYNSFFSDFLEANLKFSSLKMNRTFITFSFNIINKYKGSAHELEVLKFLRNHKSIETTNIYIHMSQLDIDFLSKQMFSRDYFGFIADGFADILFGSTQDISERTQQINVMYEKIGKDLKLEGLADTLLYLSKKEDIVRDLIYGLDEDNIHKINNMLNIGGMHSKTMHTQCLLSSEDCVYPNIDNCIGCPFAIYNFYALSAITERILKHIVTLVEGEGLAKYKGDNERNAILFIKDLKLFKEAEKKFGPCIYEFFNMSQKKFENILLKLPSLTRYLPEEREV
ncbi:hypothetical protein P9136_24355 [Bacillus cereus]|nr:hypothetical protein [Bacillus cereus]